MTKVLHSEDWIDEKKYPNVTFVFKRLNKTLSAKGNVFEVDVTGEFTLKGITKELNLPVTLTYLPNELKARNHKGDGDLLVLRTKFTIDRTAFGIKPEMGGSQVAKDIQINVSIVGLLKKK